MDKPSESQINQAKAYIDSYGHLKRGTSEARQRLDNGDDSHARLWKSHRSELADAKETLKRAGIEHKATPKSTTAKQGPIPSYASPEIHKQYAEALKSGKTGTQSFSHDRTTYVVNIPSNKDNKAQKTDAQAKTAKLGRKGKWKEAQGGPGRAGVAKIAKAMKADGKTGWVTINGAKINLGGE